MIDPDVRVSGIRFDNPKRNNGIQHHVAVPRRFFEPHVVYALMFCSPTCLRRNLPW